MSTQAKDPGNADEFSSSVEALMGELNEVERKNAPSALFGRGDRGLLRVGPRIAIVGSRSATNEGLRRARKLSRTLVARGAVVISGLAEGIDTAAHEECIASGGRTIAVLGSSLQAPYPASNRSLFESIARDHLVVSQFPRGTPVQPRNFPMRNRTMALLAHATVIVEAAEKSGTLHQAWEALRLGRPLFVLESVMKDSSLAWPKEVEAFGAQVLSEATLDDMIEQLPVGKLEEAVAF